jgi:hypothetical protein
LFSGASLIIAQHSSKPALAISDDRFKRRVDGKRALPDAPSAT